MQRRKIQSVRVQGSRILIVEFDNREQRRYDITPLLKREMFKPLSNSALFKEVMIDTDGCALVWNDKIDLSQHEVWTNGESI